MSLANIVAQNLLAAREQKNLSQAALAKKTKVSVSYVSMLERGLRTPPLHTLEVLAKALAVQPLDLLREHTRKASRRGHREHA
jgi:transcriptional regulator with XRE-family HTH domain